MRLQTIHIRNMCCQRCIEAVTDELKLLGLHIGKVKLGEATFRVSPKILETQIEKSLNKRGFILVKDENEIIVEKVKVALIDLIHRLSDTEKKNINLPAYLKEMTNTPYRTLLTIFKKEKGMTIEKYFILQKIEKTKEMIEQSSLSFSEIANLLGYKSLQHLSGQFRKLTGKSMLSYKKSKSHSRIHLDRL